MPNLRTETFGPGDQSWLGSSHAIANCRTEKLDASKFVKATHYPNGYIPSGTAVSKVGDVLVPYDATEETGNGDSFAGHVFTDQQVVSDGAILNVPLFDHGRVKAAKVPGDFTAPAAQPNTTIVYL